MMRSMSVPSTREAAVPPASYRVTWDSVIRKMSGAPSIVIASILT